MPGARALVTAEGGGSRAPCDGCAWRAAELRGMLKAHRPQPGPHRATMPGAALNTTACRRAPHTALPSSGTLTAHGLLSLPRDRRSLSTAPAQPRCGKCHACCRACKSGGGSWGPAPEGSHLMAFTSPWWPVKRCVGAASPRRHRHMVASWLLVAKVRPSRQSTSSVAPARRRTTR